MLGALFREDKLANEASVGQTALKVMQAYREVVALYYGLPSSLPKPRRGEIDLLDYGQAACFKGTAHNGGAYKKLDSSSLAQGNGKTGVPPAPSAISLHEKRPPGFSTRATSRARPSLSPMFMVTAYDQT